MTSIKKKTLSGISYILSSRMLQEMVHLGTTVVLVRLLLPDTFGLLGMVLVVIGFFSVLQPFGLGNAIVQDRDINQRQLSLIFWRSGLFGIAVMLCVIVCAPLIARFYNDPRVGPVIIALSVNFPLGAFATVHFALLSRSMEFRKIAGINNRDGWAVNAAWRSAAEEWLLQNKVIEIIPGTEKVSTDFGALSAHN